MADEKKTTRKKNAEEAPEEVAEETQAPGEEKPKRKPAAKKAAPKKAKEAPAEEAADETPAEPVAEAPADEPVAEAEPAPASEQPAADEPPAEPEPVTEEPAAVAVEEQPPAGKEAEAPAQPQPKKKRKHVPRTQRRQRPKIVRERPGQRAPISRQPKPESERGRRQERRGVVVASAMDKTIVVKVDTIKAHPRYKKVVRRSVKFHAHDEQNVAKVGDTVRIVETRPLSKLKNWRLAEVVEAAR
jgi:small subunit ribosomal protein S17